MDNITSDIKGRLSPFATVTASTLLGRLYNVGRLLGGFDCIQPQEHGRWEDGCYHSGTCPGRLFCGKGLEVFIDVLRILIGIFSRKELPTIGPVVQAET